MRFGEAFLNNLRRRFYLQVSLSAVSGQGCCPAQRTENRVVADGRTNVGLISISPCGFNGRRVILWSVTPRLHVYRLLIILSADYSLC